MTKVIGLRVEPSASGCPQNENIQSGGEDGTQYTHKKQTNNKTTKPIFF